MEVVLVKCFAYVHCFVNKLHITIISGNGIFLINMCLTWAQVICLICIPKDRELGVFISDKSQVPVLQLLCNTSGKADSFHANMNEITRFFLYVHLKDLIMVKCG